MAATEAASLEPETTVEGGQTAPSPAKPRGRGRPPSKVPKVPKVKVPKVPKEKVPKVPKEKVPRGRGRPKGRAKPTGIDTPPIHDMVIEALETLQDRKGVTFQAIRRYMEENYKVDLHRQAVRIRKAILAGVESGDIIRMRGHGVLGWFKLKPYAIAVPYKRAAPEDYVQLPYGKSSEIKKRIGKIGRPKKATADAAAVNSPAKGKRGRPKKT